jgi:PPM family protein phosphatase
MQSYYKTDRGKVRQLNEDSVTILKNDAQWLLAVIADGMGGHRAGDVASTMTVNLLENLWKDTGEFENLQETESWLSKQLLYINNELYSHAKSNPECEGMGTTVVATIISDDFITIGHVGDSRCYFGRENALLEQKTEDHSLVNELLRSGEISETEAQNHPKRNVLLQALGTDKVVNVSIQSLRWEKDNIVFLCSDGLSDKIPKEKIESTLMNGQTLQSIAETLIDMANEMGGEDNISVAIVKNSDLRSESEC